MQEIGKQTHDFHFILAISVREKLEKVRLPCGKGCCSTKIREIIRLMYPQLEEMHFSGMEFESRYQLIDIDPDVVRQGVHVDLPPEIYRRLKLLHQDLNLYSIAQLVRGILKVFLDFVKLHGDAWQEQLKKWMKKVKRKHKSTYHYRKIRQFLSFNQGKAVLITVYNSFFSPIQIYRC